LFPIRSEVISVLASLGNVQFNAAFFSALFSIIVIDLILAGDNAVVIAMAVRGLPKEQRTRGILYGSAAAVLLRVVLTFFVAKILGIPFVKLVGGLVILWIAVKLFVEDEEAEELHEQAATLWHAVKIIIIADITMALDNMLAVGAASHGNLFLLIFGLGLSIPFIVFASSLLSRLMDRFPIIIYAGAALLGKIGGEMVITDPFVRNLANPAPWLIYAVELVCASGVILYGRLRVTQDAARTE
jgi:YjbE family integral membrane protein